MAVLLTDGKNYIAHSKAGAVITVDTIGQAQDFHTVGRAKRQKEKIPAKCAGYYWVNTEKEGNKIAKQHVPGKKRRRFSAKERMGIYRKTEGHCYLCGEFVDFGSFEVEHHIPISKGGTNDLDNLYCSCKTCNAIKRDIYPQEFMEKISQIFMYQMQKKYGDRLDWKVVYRLLAAMG